MTAKETPKSNAHMMAKVDRDPFDVIVLLGLMIIIFLLSCFYYIISRVIS